MADTVRTLVLQDSESEYIALFTNASDGIGEADVVKIDVSALSPAAYAVTVMEIWWSCRGMSVKLFEEATTDVLLYVCTQGEGHHDFSKIGGLTCSQATGWTGDIGFTTVGHDDGDAYSIVIRARKQIRK